MVFTHDLSGTGSSERTRIVQGGREGPERCGVQFITIIWRHFRIKEWKGYFNVGRKLKPIKEKRSNSRLL